MQRTSPKPVEQLKAESLGHEWVPPAQAAGQRVEAKVAQNEKEVQQLKQDMAKLAALKAGKKMTPQQIRESVDLLFQKYDFSPVEELIKLATRTDDEALAARICMHLMEFILPKMKSIEVSGQVDHTHTVVIRRFGKEDQQLAQPAVPGQLPPTAQMSDHRIDAAIDVEASHE